jgi:hypothetical protein
LCDPKLCPESPDDGGRCEHCALDKLDAAQNTESGQLLRRALDLKAAIKLGITVSLDEIAADECYAMNVIEQEQEKKQREDAGNGG